MSIWYGIGVQYRNNEKVFLNLLVDGWRSLMAQHELFHRERALFRSGDDSGANKGDNLQTPRMDHRWLTRQTEDWHGNVTKQVVDIRQSPKTEVWGKLIVGDAFHSTALASLLVTVMTVTITRLATISSQVLRSRPTANDQVWYNQGWWFESILPRKLCRNGPLERVENSVGSSVLVTS